MKTRYKILIPVTIAVFLLVAVVYPTVNYKTWGNNELYYANPPLGTKIVCDEWLWQPPQNCKPVHNIIDTDEQDAIVFSDSSDPNTMVIHNARQGNGVRLSITPQFLILNLTGNDYVTFANQDAGTVDIFDKYRGQWQFENVEPLSTRILPINNTGYYEILVQNAIYGQTGAIIALSEDTNSLPLAERAKMAQRIISNNSEINTEVIFVGSEGINPGLTIGIHEKFKNESDAERFYYEKYRNMIPFDVPITIEFTRPIMTTSRLG